jgi:hypothetical protein
MQRIGRPSLLIIGWFLVTYSPAMLTASALADEGDITCDDGSVIRFNEQENTAQIISPSGMASADLPHSSGEGIVDTWSATPKALGCRAEIAPCIDFVRREEQVSEFWHLAAPDAEPVRCSAIIE